MALAPDTQTYRAATAESEQLARALIAQPNEDVRELLAERCRNLGIDPLVDDADLGEGLPDVDVIILEPASLEGRRLLALHAAQASSIPLVFVSVYPPVGLISSPAVAYLMLPCSRERFEAALAKAL